MQPAYRILRSATEDDAKLVSGAQLGPSTEIHRRVVLLDNMCAKVSWRGCLRRIFS